MRAVKKHAKDKWVVLYIERWRKAPAQEEAGHVTERGKGTPQGGVISPLLANLFLHYAFDRWMQRTYPHLPFERYADDAMVHCRTETEAQEVRRAIAERMQACRLELHPEKTRRVDLSWGRQGFDFLGCHLHKRISGRIWEQQGRRVYFLQRWPSVRSMKRVRGRVKELTDRSWNWVSDVRELIDMLNPFLRGWGNYFRTGNAATKFNQVDTYVVWRLKRFLIQRKGRHLRAGEVDRWTREYFEALGLHRLRGTIRYPGTPFWEPA